MAKIPARPFFAISGGTRNGRLCQSSQMAKRPKIEWFARAWRKKRKFTLQEVADAIGMSVSYLHDLEKGDKRWNQDHLDALAQAYGLDDPLDLLRDPNRPLDPLLRLVQGLSKEQYETAERVLSAILKKTGTDG